MFEEIIPCMDGVPDISTRRDERGTLDAELRCLVSDALGRVFTAAQLEIRLAGQVLVSNSYGCTDLESGAHPVGSETLFDIASVSKLFTSAAFMTLVDEGAVAVDDPVCSALREFRGFRPIVAEGGGASTGSVDAGGVTFRHLLSHSSGLPPWRRLCDEDGRDAIERALLQSPFAYRPGARVVYSDLGMMILGLSLERLCSMPLDEVVRRRVLEPLGLGLTRYLPAPVDRGLTEGLSIVPTEFCAWRKRRIVGEVHDEAAAALGGVAGHAGLFSTASELATFGQCFLEGGKGLLSPASAAEMTRVQAAEGGLSRGLGFALWSPDEEAASNPLGRRAFGHLGFTGASLWMDPDAALVVSCLTNRVYFGRDARGISSFRVALHRSASRFAHRAWDRLGTIQA
jgi:serine-type D-Ala-D-Ala carboxypeptidase